MRHSVTTPAYMLMKTIDNFLFSLSSRGKNSQGSAALLSRVTFPSEAPSGWIPLYTMITFRPDVSYGTAKRLAGRQSRILRGAGILGVVGVLAVGWFTCRPLGRR